jgi:two-component system chemotaxis response regulator CheB
MAGPDIIVVGASAGGVEALSRVVADLPEDLPASVFIVLHIPPMPTSALPTILGRRARLPVAHAIEGEAIKTGRIYVAPPDRHLLVLPGRVRVAAGPRENGHRPAVDPLFRSAAVAYGSRVVAVVLSGSLDDGTAGLLAIKRRGGVAVVQDPSDALYPSMPRSAMENVEVDHCLPLPGIAPVLARVAGEPADEEGVYAVPNDMELESKIAEMDEAALRGDERPGIPSAFSCPECNGVLWEIHEDELVRFRCRVGHAFSAESVLAEQSEALEEALWAALNTLEESASLAHRMAGQARSRGQSRLAARMEEKKRDAELRAEVIRQVLVKGETVPMDDSAGVDRAVADL